MEHEQIRLDAIRLDGGTQPRVELNENTIADYAEAMESDAPLPPIVVFHDGAAHWLADGFHRYHGARKAGKVSIEAEVRQGTRRDAVLFSVGVNATHGLRRSNADKRKAVETLLRDDEWSRWSNVEIAKRCIVSEYLVREVRPIFDLNEDSRTRTVQRGDATYTQNTGNIGRAASTREAVSIGSRHNAQELAGRAASTRAPPTIESSESDWTNTPDSSETAFETCLDLCLYMARHSDEIREDDALFDWVVSMAQMLSARETEPKDDAPTEDGMAAWRGECGGCEHVWHWNQAVEMERALRSERFCVVCGEMDSISLQRVVS